MKADGAKHFQPEPDGALRSFLRHPPGTGGHNACHHEEATTQGARRDVGHQRHCLTDEGNAAVFVIVGHCTGECLGIRAALRGTRFEAIECLCESVQFAEGRCEDKVAKDTRRRHDYGSQFISHTFQDELRTLGIESSPSLVRQPRATGASSDSSAR